ncbi:MAG: EamA family transporter [Phascolarctobacterium sp.]|uniref:DMT family transporter n=1 Tax=Phascolarctobacterium sp. TaxID=2049039 RepID=UPI0026DBB369|nr:EamA family transporter [Phascolarctobacterium sp.]MDO4920352.1 EamA family transporter [Phascolarctobacterium sp.]
MLKGVILIVCAATCWGMGGVSGQYLFEYHQVDSVWLVMVRQIIGGLLFLGYAALVQKQNVVRALLDNSKDLVEFSFLGILGAQLGFYYSITLCNAATATVLQYMAPIYVMLWMSYKNRRWPEGRELVGIIGAVTGVFLIATHGSLDSLALSPAALVIGLVSAMSYAYYSIKPVEMLKKYYATIIIGWGQLLSGLFLILWRNPFAPVGDWDWRALLAVGYLILGATIASYALYLQGLKIVGPTKASLISCAEPLASIISVVLLLDTKLLPPDLIGMGCIIFTVLMLSLPKK